MTLTTTTNKASYSGDGNTTTFAYAFKILADSDLKVYIRSASGTETLKTITTHYTVTGVGSASGGNVVFTGGNIPTNTETVVIQRVVPLTQTHDYVENDPFPAESHEQGLDRLTMHVQQLQEEVDRSIKASVSNTISSTEFTNDATDRANKLFAFDSSGNINIATTIGSNTGNWATATAYAERDIVKDTSTNNIFQCKTAHTSSGSQPLTTNTDSAKWDLLVDAESATTSATNASNSATASANSATASANSATQSATSATDSANSATASAGSATTASNHVTTASGHATDSSEHKQTAERWANHTGSTVTDVDTGVDSGEYSAKHYAQQTASTYDDFDDRYLGAKSSAPTQDNDGNSLQTGSLYWNTSNNNLYVWDGSSWVQGAFSSGGFLSTGNNLSDLSNPGTARTNLGLGTSAVLDVGTSANNIPQLDGNAKLPAVDGSQLTGMASGGTIDMTIGAGSSAVSVGDTITRETNGETKKIEISTTTTNHSLATTSGFASQSLPSDREWTTCGADIGASNDGRYLYAFVTAQASNSQNWYWYYQSFVHDGSGGWTVGTPTQVSSYNDWGGYGNNKRNDNIRVEYLESVNSGDGGTFVINSIYGTGSYGGYGSSRYMHLFTMDSSGAVTYKHTQHVGSMMLSDETDSTYTSSSDICSFDYGIIDISGNVANFVAHACYSRTIPWVGYFGKQFLAEITITYDPNADTYTFQKIRNYADGSCPPNQNTVYASSLCVVHDPAGNGTNQTFVVFSSGGSTSTSGNMYMQRWVKHPSNSYGFTWNGSTTFISGLAYNNDGGWRVKAQSGKVCGFINMGTDTSASNSSKEIKYVTYNGSLGNVQSAVNNSSTYGNGIYGPAPSGKYDYFNDAYITLGDNPARKGQNNHISSYPISTSDSGSSITVGSATNVNDASNNEPTKYNFLHTLGFAGAGFSNMGQTSLSGANAGKANRWLYITTANYEGNPDGYKHGVMELTTNVTATNKSLFFGFAQEAGSAGGSIKVMPNDAEGLESNVSGLTHSSLYYVADNGSLTATAGTDNPLAGKAIGTGALRLPTASISGGGSSASSDTSKIFCGAVDLKNDSGVQSSFTLSKPANLNAEDIRAYIIEYYGIMTSTGTGDYYVLQMKPYNSGSSVMNSTFYGGGFYYGGGTDGSYNTNMSTYLNIAYQGGVTLQGASSSTRASNAIMYSPSWSGVCLYENNMNQASIDYWSIMRYGTNNNHIRKEWYTGGANNNQTTSNYADAFYFEPRTGTWSEGVVSLYAITK